MTAHRRCMLLLLLLVLASQLTLTAHAVNHESSDAAGCQLCIGYHSLGQALTGASMPAPEAPAIPVYNSSLSIPLVETALIPYRQRAPPYSV